LEPWTPICITSNLKSQIVAGDAWGEDFVGSSAFGVTRYYVDKHLSGELESTLLIDNSIPMVQLDVDEDIAILFCRSSNSIDDPTDMRNGQMYAIPLDVFMHRESPLSKKELNKHYMVSRTKGAYVYSIHQAATSTASILQNACKMAVAVGKKLRTFRFIPTNPARVPGMGTGGVFEMLHEYPTAETIQALVIGEPSAGNTGQQVSAALQSGTFALINIESGLETPLGLDESAIQVNPVMCLQVSDPIDAMQQEFVICYNQSVEFKHTNGHNSRQYGVRLSSRPHAIAYVYPYLLGFTNNSIEVVTMINGSLVKTMPMQRCQFLNNKRGVYFTSTLDGTSMLYKMSEDTLSGKTTVDGSTMGQPLQVAAGNVFVRRMSVSKMSHDVKEAQDRVQDRRSSTSPKKHSGMSETFISDEVVNSNRRINPLFDDAE